MLRLNTYLFTMAVVLVLIAFTACAPLQHPEQAAPESTATAGNITDNQTVIQTTHPIPEDSMPRISINELKQKIDSGADIMVVDTRHREEYDIDHIKGAVSAPLDDIIAGKWQPPANKELILYCGWPDERTSARAALELVNTVDKIWVLKGGYNAWKEAGYPMETGIPQEVFMIVPGYGDNYMMISPGGNINVGK